MDGFQRDDKIFSNPRKNLVFPAECLLNSEQISSWTEERFLLIIPGFLLHGGGVNPWFPVTWRWC